MKPIWKLISISKRQYEANIKTSTLGEPKELEKGTSDISVKLPLHATCDHKDSSM